MSGNNDIKYNGKLFVEACQKSGLKVNSKARKHIASGLVIRDGEGCKYTLNPNGELVQTGFNLHIDNSSMNKVLMKRLKTRKIVANRPSRRRHAFKAILLEKKGIKVQED